MYRRLGQSDHSQRHAVVVVVVVVVVVRPVAERRQTTQRATTTTAVDLRRSRIIDRQSVGQRRVIESLVCRHCLHVDLIHPALISTDQSQLLFVQQTQVGVITKR